MNLIDRIINYFSPKAGCERELWRSERDSLKGYDAAAFDRLNEAWRVLNESAEITDRGSRDTIRARARDQERNSDITSSILIAYKRNVVGAGYTLQAKTGSDELDDQLEGLWKIWCNKNNCDVTGTQNFNQLLRMAITRKKVDGGALFLKRYTAGGIVPFKLQAIEVDELEESALTPREKGNKVAGGIEYSSYNKPMGFYIRQYQIDGMSSEPVYVPAKDVIFIYTKKRPSQIREMSDLTAMIPRTRDINEYMTAVSVKERIAACLAVFVTRQSMGGLGRNTKDNSAKSGYDTKTLTPGMISHLMPGEDITVVDPKSQAVDATNYLKLMQRLIGSGQGLSYEAVSRDMSETNYSGARQGSIEDDLTYAEEIEALMDFMDEVYETFVISLYLSGRINVANFWDDFGTYTKHNWVGSTKKWIDPLKESTANRVALNSNQKSYQQIAAEGGKDWKEIIDENAEVIKYAKSKGILLGGEKNG